MYGPHSPRRIPAIDDRSLTEAAIVALGTTALIVGTTLVALAATALVGGSLAVAAALFVGLATVAFVLGRRLGVRLGGPPNRRRSPFRPR